MSAPIFRYPKDYIGITRGFTDTHRGVDLGWSGTYGGKNAPLLAPADGTVIISSDGMEDNASGENSGRDWGNNVMLDHGNGWYSRSAHMQNGSVCVSAGQSVKRGDRLGNMGNSGNSLGWHDHYEVYSGGVSTKFRVDPMLYTYVFPDQTVSSKTACANKLKYYLISWGTPVERNAAADQVIIEIKDLYARDGAAGNKKGGFMTPGVYNALEVKESEGYIWVMVEQGLWCACGEGLAEFHKATEKDEENEGRRIAELISENERLTQSNERLREKIEGAMKALGEE